MKKLTLNPIANDADYRAALKAAERMFDLPNEPEPQSPEGAYFDALVTLIEAYERKHHPIDPPDPIDAIKFRMEQAGLTPTDLAPYIGGRGRVSEILNRKRPLTLGMIRRLVTGLHIPADVLIAHTP